MSVNASILAKIAEAEATLAELRSLVVGCVDVGKATDTPMKVVGEPLTSEDLKAMVKAGVKAGAHVKGMAKTVFKAMDIPEYQHEAARAQWKAYRGDVSDEDAALEEQEPVLSEEMLESLKEHGEYDAKTRTSKMRSEFIDYGIHAVLHDRAGKQWREWAEAQGLGERMKAPKRPVSVRAKAKAEGSAAVLSEEMLLEIKGAKDKAGKPFHSGSQRRSLERTLEGLGVPASEHTRATKEWKVWAKAMDIVRGGSTSGSDTGSVGSADDAAPAAAAAASAATPAAASAAAPAAPTITKVLAPAQLSRISDMFSLNPAPGAPDLRKAFKQLGVPKVSWLAAEKQWTVWAKDNHRVTESDELDLGLDEDEQ